MNLIEILKQFKNIEPDKERSELSKRAILAMPQNAKRGSAWGFLRVFETGIAFVLVGFFVLLITGGYSAVPSLSPVQYSVIDPASLHAEAQAIDIQIQLASVKYPDAGSTTSALAALKNGSQSTSSARRAAIIKPVSTTSSSSAATPEGTSSATSAATSSPLTIDEALQQLSQ